MPARALIPFVVAGGCFAQPLHPFSESLAARQAREEREARPYHMALSLARTGIDAAHRGDCEQVRRAQANILSLPRTELGDPYHDVFLLDRFVGRCLGVDACRDMHALVQAEPELATDPRYVKCRGIAPRQYRAKTARELCLDKRRAAMHQAQQIDDPSDRGAALRSIPTCPDQ